MPSGPNSGSFQEGTSKHWPCQKPTQRQAWPAGDQAWFNSGIFAGDKSGVAGVELATASEPPARQPRILGASPFGRRPQPPLSCDLRLNHALNEYLDWPGVAQVGQVESDVVKDGKTTHETRYFITSVSRAVADAGQLLKWTRGH